MEQGTFGFGEATAPPPVKLCECGCGEPAPLAPQNDQNAGLVKGQPQRFIRGHYARTISARTAARHALEPAPEVKLCECGCGLPAPIAKGTDATRGAVRGQPQRFIRGHRAKEQGTGPREHTRKLSVEMGQQIGWSTVMDPETVVTGSSGRTARAARLRCECGAEYVRQLWEISQSLDDDTGWCPECRYEDLTGRTFGRLAVVRVIREKSNSGPDRVRWLCRCRCKKEVTVRQCDLTNGHTKSCGCGIHAPKNGRTVGEAGLKRVWDRYRAGAEGRNFSWNLTMEQFAYLISLNCAYCDRVPSGRYGAFRYTGIDRMDNKAGYEPFNVSPCCWPCNKSKKETKSEDYIALLLRGGAYQATSPDMTPPLLRDRVAP